MVKASIKSTRHGLEGMSNSVADRVIDSIQPGPDGCMISTYTSSTSGGPQIQWRVDGELYFMYHWRIIYYLDTGTIPERYTLFRTCKDAHCVNPDHRKARR